MRRSHRCTRLLHHRQTAIRKLASRGTVETVRCRALPLSYRPSGVGPGGNRTRVSRVAGEVTALFTTGWFWMTGNRRQREPSLVRRQSALPGRARPAFLPCEERDVFTTAKPGDSRCCVVPWKPFAVPGNRRDLRPFRPFRAIRHVLYR